MFSLSFNKQVHVFKPLLFMFYIRISGQGIIYPELRQIHVHEPWSLV